MLTGPLGLCTAKLLFGSSIQYPTSTPVQGNLSAPHDNLDRKSDNFNQPSGVNGDLHSTTESRSAQSTPVRSSTSGYSSRRTDAAGSGTRESTPGSSVFGDVSSVTTESTLPSPFSLRRYVVISTDQQQESCLDAAGDRPRRGQKLHWRQASRDSELSGRLTEEETSVDEDLESHIYHC